MHVSAGASRGQRFPFPMKLVFIGSCEPLMRCEESSSELRGEQNVSLNKRSSTIIKSFERHLFNNYVLVCQTSSRLGAIMEAKMEKGNIIAISILCYKVNFLFLFGP